MERKTPSPLSKLAKLVLVLAVLLLGAPALRQAAASPRPCPSGCGYTWDPVTRCCDPDPRFDCVSICF